MGLSDVLLTTLTLKALGDVGDTSHLDITMNYLFNSSEGDIPTSIDNGNFTVSKTTGGRNGGGTGGGGGGGLSLQQFTTPTPTATPTKTPPSMTIPPMPSTPEETPTETPTKIPTATPEPTTTEGPTPFWQQPTMTISISALIVAAIVVLAYIARRK